MKLTDKKCKLAKPQDKSYKLFDGGGFYLEVLPSGKKHWRLKYHYMGKEKRLSLGGYPVVSLADARDRRDEYKKMLLDNIDPATAKKDQIAEETKKAQNTFKAVALEWFDVKAESWSEKYAQKVMLGLEKNIFPFLGNRPIDEITPPELLECLRKMEKRGSFDIANRTKQICGQVFRFGIQTGKCERDAAADLKDALKTRKTEHYRTIDCSQLPDFLKALERNEARIYESTRRAVWLSLLTFLRPKEIRMARWHDINLQEKVWIIPAEIMKTRREHIVPLSTQALSILQAQQESLEGINTEWVFPSYKSLRQPMSDGTVNKAIKRLGYGDEMVAHGVRALARTLIREQLNYDSEVIEKQLAHKSSGPLGEAYDRTQYLSQRAEMMQDWADYLISLESHSNVSIANFRRSAV